MGRFPKIISCNLNITLSIHSVLLFAKWEVNSKSSGNSFDYSHLATRRGGGGGGSSDWGSYKLLLAAAAYRGGLDGARQNIIVSASANYDNIRFLGCQPSLNGMGASPPIAVCTPFNDKLTPIKCYTLYRNNARDRQICYCAFLWN